MGEEENKTGEEVKKPEGGTKEDGKVEKSEEGKKVEESKDDPGKEAKDPPPPLPQEIILRVYMHCEGCARKVRRCLKGFEGVEDVLTDCKVQMVVVKGEKANPLKVLERVQRKSHRKVELLSPIPKPLPAAEPKKPEEKEIPKPEEKKEEVITVVLKVYMHCEACAQEIKKRIQRMKGVESAEPDLKSSQVTVKGAFEASKLVEYVHKRTGKHAVIIKVDPETKEENKSKEGKEEKKTEEGGKENKKAEEEGKEKKEESGSSGGGADVTPAKTEAEQEGTKLELKKNESFYPYPQHFQYPPHQHHYQNQVYYPQIIPQEMRVYPPQIFSDENPNACSIM